MSNQTSNSCLIRGPRGLMGPHGKQGRDGVDGSPGMPGKPGIDGPPGDRGPPGEVGLALAGLPGPGGFHGSAGAPGPAGPDGPMGDPGFNADEGPPGPPGPDGPNGDTGPTGPTGFTGGSAEFTFNIESGSDACGDPTSGPVTVAAGDTVRFWSAGGIFFNVEDGSALLQIEPNNIVSTNVPPSGDPPDTSRPAFHYDNSVNRLYYWDRLDSFSGRWRVINVEAAQEVGFSACGETAGDVRIGSVLKTTNQNSWLLIGLQQGSQSFITGRIPTSTSEGGGCRGINAVDWQLKRNAINQVAGGNFSVLGGGVYNIATGAYSVILGGNANISSKTGAFIGGGVENLAISKSASILGGKTNRVSDQYSTILGGQSNTCFNSFSTVAGNLNFHGGYNGAIIGGICNSIRIGLSNSFIGSGKDNRMINYAKYSSCIGGFGNVGNSAYSCIIGGLCQKTVTGADFSAVTNGIRNRVAGKYSAIFTGRSNLISQPYSTIWTGNNRISTSSFSADLNGVERTISGQAGIILAGTSLQVSSSYGLILGGYSNNVSGNYGAIIGGKTNTVTVGNYSVIVGGTNNTIQSNFNSCIGSNHLITGAYSTIIGGSSNIITGQLSAIVGNTKSQNAGNFSIIAACYNGIIPSGAENSALIGGFRNAISSSTYQPSKNANILGGSSNQIGEATFGCPNSCIVGGEKNRIYSSLTGTNYNSIMIGGASNVINNNNISLLVGKCNSATNGGYSFISSTINLTQTGASFFNTVFSSKTNFISSSYSLVTGRSNKNYGDFSCHVGGYNNILSGANSLILGGRNNTVSGQNSVVVGGVSCVINSKYNVVNSDKNYFESSQDYCVILGSKNNNMPQIANAFGIFNVTNRTLIGGQSNKSYCFNGVALGGTCNSTSTYIDENKAGFVGGRCTPATGGYRNAIVIGGISCSARGLNSFVAGGQNVYLYTEFRNGPTVGKNAAHLGGYVIRGAEVFGTFFPSRNCANGGIMCNNIPQTNFLFSNRDHNALYAQYSIICNGQNCYIRAGYTDNNYYAAYSCLGNGKNLGDYGGAEHYSTFMTNSNFHYFPGDFSCVMGTNGRYSTGTYGMNHFVLLLEGKGMWRDEAVNNAVMMSSPYNYINRGGTRVGLSYGYNSTVFWNRYGSVGGFGPTTIAESSCSMGNVSVRQSGCFGINANLDDFLLNQFDVNFFGATCFGGGFIYSDISSNGVYLAPGGNSWASLSDVNVKTNFVLPDFEQLLERINQLPIYLWEFETETGSQHIGPMAQDFNSAFNFNGNQKFINDSDFDGVNLGGLKAIYQKYQQQVKTLYQLTQIKFRGKTKLNELGQATVTILVSLLENYYRFSYQLTVADLPCPNLHISQELVKNTFKISGGVPNASVYWQIIGQKN